MFDQTKKKAVILDLDGTLCDTLQDLADCCNRALAEAGFPTHSIPEYRYIVGNGIHKQIERALPPDQYTEAAAEQVKTAFQDYYSRGYQATTKPYEGMIDTLAGLRERGFLLIVFSNKPDAFTHDLCAGSFREPFAAILGNREGMPLKPNPSALLALLDQLGIEPENCLYCGDTGTDMQTAVRAGIPGIGALWGFRTRKELIEEGAQYLAERPLDLLAIADKMEEENSRESR